MLEKHTDQPFTPFRTGRSPTTRYLLSPADQIQEQTAEESLRGRVGLPVILLTTQDVGNDLREELAVPYRFGIQRQAFGVRVPIQKPAIPRPYGDCRIFYPGD